MLAILKCWNSREAQDKLKKVPEYERLSRYGHLSYFKFLQNLLLNDTQVSDELLIIGLYITYQEAKSFETIIKNINSRTYEEIKRKIHSILQDDKLRTLIISNSHIVKYSLHDFDKKFERDDKFRDIVKRSTNELYIVQSEFIQDNEHYAIIRHEDCMRTFSCAKKEFLSGKARCPYCKNEITEWMLEHLVDEKGMGRYQLSKTNHIVRTKQYFVKDIKKDKLYSINKDELFNCIKTNNWSILNEKHLIPFSSFVFEVKSNTVYQKYLEKV